MPDEIVQTPPGPALSATADTPEVRSAPPPLSASGMASEGPPADPAPVVTDPPAPDTTDPVEPADPVDPEPVDPPADPDPAPVEAKPDAREDRGVGKRLNQYERDLAAAQARIDELARVNDTLLRQRVEPPKPAEPAPPVEVKPDLLPEYPRASQFESPEAHETALAVYHSDVAAWTSRQAKAEAKAIVAADRAVTDHQANTDRARSNFSTAEAAHQERVSKATEKHSDFAEVAFAKDVPISPSMGLMIINSDVGDEIMYHLGKNKADAARIAGLVMPGQFYPQGHEWAGMPVPNLAAQAREMGKLEGRLSAAQAAPPVVAPKKVSAAPAPVKPVGQRAAATVRKGDDLTADEYFDNHPSTLARKAAAARLGVTTH